MPDTILTLRVWGFYLINQVGNSGSLEESKRDESYRNDPMKYVDKERRTPKKCMPGQCMVRLLQRRVALCFYTRRLHRRVFLRPRPHGERGLFFFLGQRGLLVLTSALGAGGDGVYRGQHKRTSGLGPGDGAAGTGGDSVRISEQWTGNTAETYKELYTHRCRWYSVCLRCGWRQWPSAAWRR